MFLKFKYLHGLIQKSSILRANLSCLLYMTDCFSTIFDIISFCLFGIFSRYGLARDQKAVPIKDCQNVGVYILPPGVNRVDNMSLS